MAFDENLAARIRDALARRRGVEEKKMFGGGGVGFLLNGNMLVGVWKDSLIARLGPDNHEDALLEPHVREFDITGRPMKGWVLVEAEGVEDDDQLKDWIQRAGKFVGQLPVKWEMNPSDLILLLLSLAFATLSLLAHGWTLNGVGPALLSSAGGFWQF